MLRINTLVAAVAVAGLGTGFSTVAHAQAPAAKPVTVGVKVQKPFRIQIGGFFPGDGDLKKAVGKNFVSYGLSYDFFKTKAESPTIVSLYVDGILPKDKKTTITVGQASTQVKSNYSFVGVGPEARVYFAPATAPLNYFAGLGVGPYFLHAKIDDVSKSKTAFGGKIFAGIESNSGIYGTVEYTLLSKVKVTEGPASADIKGSGIGASIGYRF